MQKKYKVVISGEEIDLVKPDGFEDDEDFWFYITLHNTDTVIGEIIFDDKYRNVELDGNVGYSIDNKYNGHGYAKKALDLLKKVLIDKKDKMLINVYEGNEASRKTAINFGAKLVRKGIKPDKYIIDKKGGYSNSYMVFEYDLKSIDNNKKIS